MSDLREKITQLIYENSSDDLECLRIKFEKVEPIINNLEFLFQSELEKQRDEFAEGFAEFLRNDFYDNGEKWTEWDSDDNSFTSFELLEKYKEYLHSKK